MSDHGAQDGNGQVLTQPDETPAGGLAVVVAIGVVIVVATIASVHGLYEQYDRDALAVKTEPGFGQNADTVFAQQETKLDGYGVGDLQRGTFAIPIERASKLVLDELAANPEAQVTGPAPPPPAPAADAPKTPEAPPATP